MFWRWAELIEGNRTCRISRVVMYFSLFFGIRNSNFFKLKWDMKMSHKFTNFVLTFTHWCFWVLDLTIGYSVGRTFEILLSRNSFLVYYLKNIVILPLVDYMLYIMINYFVSFTFLTFILRKTVHVGIENRNIYVVFNKNIRFSLTLRLFILYSPVVVIKEKMGNNENGKN